MKDVVGVDIHEGDFIIYATKSEAPSLQFAWVHEIKEVTKKSWNDHEYTEVKVKIHRAEKDGTRKNKIVSDYFPENPTGQQFVDRDTGTPDMVWLNGTTGQDHRLMVIS